MKKNSETHPFFPSGEWTGFYTVGKGSQQHSKAIDLAFGKKRLRGTGTDDIAPFEILGNYNLQDFKVKFTKHYKTHKIAYEGQADENGIWGTWSNIIKDIPGFSRDEILAFSVSLDQPLQGGFHIWPKGKATTNTVQEKRKKSKSFSKTPAKKRYLVS